MLSVCHQLSVKHSGHQPVKVSVIVNQYCYIVLTIRTAPSASPEMINVSSVRSSSIDVSWGEVPCLHCNGEITGYVIMYKKKGGREGGGEGRQMSRQSQVEMIMVDGHTVTINDLDLLTEYSVMVAGVNSAGTGQFSEPVTVVTEGTTFSTVITQCMCQCKYIIIHLLVNYACYIM